jgi:4-amino-4-deoxy-L-arabinose transferase-like glycosyltransferase
MPRNPIFVLLLFAGVVSGFIFLYQLDRLPIRLWDEARNASNAIEMLQNHHWLIRYYNGAPDLYELKPPFLIWAQVLSLNIFGINEWAIRLPTALAAIYTCLFLTYSIAKEFHPLAGLISGLTLASTPAYYGEHMGRTGDHDSLLVLFTFMAFFFVFMAAEKRNSRWLVLACVAIFFGWATKSIAAFFLAPAMLLWLLIRRNGRLIIQPHVILASGLCLLLITSYYVFHEFATPGYLKEVISNEWWGRYFGTSHNFVHRKDTFWLYFNNWPKRYSIFWPLIFCCIPAWFLCKNEKLKNFILYCTICIITTMLILSAGTKNFWYDGIVLPIAACLTGVSVFVVLKALISLVRIKGSRLILFVCCLLSVFNPVQFAVHAVVNQKEWDWDRQGYGISYFLKDDKNMQQVKGVRLYVLYNDINNHLLFYRDKWVLNGLDVKVIFEIPMEIKSGDKVIVSQLSFINVLAKDRSLVATTRNENYHLFEKR